MKKLLLLLLVTAGMMSTLVEARRGRGGYRHRGGWGRRGYHRPYYRRRGYWGRPWGYGPSVAFTVPIGGDSKAQPTGPGAPYYEFKSQTGLDPINVPGRYLNWLRNNPKYRATYKTWYRQFKAYRSSLSYSSRGGSGRGYVSFGFGGGYGGRWW